jgi:hypothetical protein
MLFPLSSEDKQNIQNDDLVPMIRRDIRGFIASRRIMRRLSDALECTAKFLVLAGACLAFVATQDTRPRFMVATGLLNVVSISTFSLSSYFQKECSERTSRLNRTLESIGMSVIPDVTEAQARI